MKLFFTTYGNGAPIAVLHGLFGSADNWATLGKRMAETHKVYLVDQRNHGRSPHSPEQSYDLMAHDLKLFFDSEGINTSVLLGHSMGGKTAMRFAQLFPERVQKLVVADMGVKRYQPHHGPIFDALNSIDLASIASRSEAEASMGVLMKDASVRQFLLKSLYRTEDKSFAWRMNHQTLEKEIDHILAPLPFEPSEVPALFIRGTKSDYITDADKPEIQKYFRKATFADVEAGHWLHAENPDAFFHIFMDYVTK